MFCLLVALRFIVCEVNLDFSEMSVYENSQNAKQKVEFLQICANR